MSKIKTENYIIITSKKSVVVFSKFYIPFEIDKVKHADKEKFKEELKKAISDMEQDEDCILKARYGTTAINISDVENTLFYNLGTTNFKKFTKNGLTFSKVEKEEVRFLQRQYEISDEYSHYYEYEIGKNVPHIKFEKMLAKWENVSLKCVALKPAIVWKTLKGEKSKIKTFGKINTEEKNTFAVCLTIEKPQNNKSNIITAMKSLLDGVICVFHSSYFNKNEIEKLMLKIGCEDKMLIDATLSVLGNRKTKFVNEYGKSINWNPADELCNYVYISVKEGNSWNISGEIYSIAI